jgi:hypothetical protein
MEEMRMTLSQYFEKKIGKGVIATSNREGKAGVAVLPIVGAK